MYFPNSCLSNMSSRWAETGLGRHRIAPCPVEHEKEFSSGLRGISDRKSGSVELGYVLVKPSNLLETPFEQK